MPEVNEQILLVRGAISLLSEEDQAAIKTLHAELRGMVTTAKTKQVGQAALALLALEIADES